MSQRNNETYKTGFRHGFNAAMQHIAYEARFNSGARLGELLNAHINAEFVGHPRKEENA
jgi:hypothetical protein